MSINSLLNQTATIANKASYGADGEPSFSAGASVKCRLEADSKRMLLPTGQTIVIDAMMIVGPDTTVNTEDKVTLGSVYKVVDIFEVPDDLGNVHHKELRLVKWVA